MLPTIIRFSLFILMLAAVFHVHASESGSQVAWTGDAVKLIKSGNQANGKALAETCKTCHGPRGEGFEPEKNEDGELSPAMPALAGQNPYFMYKQLRDFVNGDRADPIMTGIAKGLSEQDTADLAAWFSALSLPSHPDSDEDLSIAKKMVSQGDGKRILPPCFVCHGKQGQGDKIDIPSLAGQPAAYLEKTLLEYRSGARHNDIYSRMRLIAKQLNANEIKQLAKYYEELK
jgi:cytochrome c553